MWTSKNRGRYDRSKLRYPSDLTDDEWKLVEPLIPPGKPGGGKRPVISVPTKKPRLHSRGRSQMGKQRVLDRYKSARPRALIWIKTGHCQFQIRPLGVETGQYPTENEAGEKFQLTVNRWLEIIVGKLAGMTVFKEAGRV